MWLLRVTQISSTRRITDWSRLGSCTAASRARSGEAEPVTTKEVLITAQDKYKHLGKRRIPSGKQRTSSSTTARRRSQSSRRRDAKGQEAQRKRSQAVKQDNACRSGTRRYLAQPGPGLCLHSTEHLTPSLAGSDKSQALRRAVQDTAAPTEMVSTFLNDPRPARPPPFPGRRRAGPDQLARTFSKRAEVCLPVDDPQGFVDGHAPAALLRLPVPLVFGVHVLLREVTAREVKVRRVQGDEFGEQHVLHLQCTERNTGDSGGGSPWLFVLLQRYQCQALGCAGVLAEAGPTLLNSSVSHAPALPRGRCPPLPAPCPPPAGRGSGWALPTAERSEPSGTALHSLNP